METDQTRPALTEHDLLRRCQSLGSNPKDETAIDVDIDKIERTDTFDSNAIITTDEIIVGEINISSYLDPVVDATQRGLGIAVDLEMATRPAVDAGFSVARIAANVGFELASSFVEFMSGAVAADPTVADNVHSVIKAGQYVADSSITATKVITTTTLRASTDLFLATGAKEGELWRAIFGAELAGVLQQLYAVMGEVADSLETLSIIEVVQCMDLMRRIELLKMGVVDGHMRFVGETDSLMFNLPLHLRSVDPDKLHTFLKFSIAAYGVVFLRMLLVLPVSTTLTVTTDTDCICYFTGISPEDIVTQQIVAVPFLVGYYVALHHATKSIVVAFRGTNNIHDVFVDLTCKSVQLYNINEGAPTTDENATSADTEPLFAHQGFVEATKKLDPLKSQLLELLHTHPEYTLVLTGHSLGAAMASIVALHWKKDFEHLNNDINTDRFVCYAYAPPGVVSATTSNELSYITSVVLGNDLVSRASLASMKNLCQSLLHLRETGVRKVSRILEALETCTASQEDVIALDGILETFKSFENKPLLFPAGRVLWMNSDILNDEYTTSQPIGAVSTAESKIKTNNINCCVFKWINPTKCLRDMLITSDCVTIHMQSSWLAAFEKFTARPLIAVATSQDNFKLLCYRFDNN